MFSRAYKGGEERKKLLGRGGSKHYDDVRQSLIKIGRYAYMWDCGVFGKFKGARLNFSLDPCRNRV